jgi:histidine phosphotransferase ChpT
MAGTGEAEFLQLLVSHICHELVSAVGAIGNGVELLEEMGTLDPEALGLVAQSSRTAAAKLRLLRVVYGSAGLSTDFRLPEAHKALADLFAIDAKFTLDWAVPAPPELAPGAVQLVAGLVLLAATCLPRGGVIGVALARTGSGARLSIRPNGTGARLPEEIRLALGGQGAADHKTIHAHFCAWAAARLGIAVAAQAAAPDGIELSAILPFPAEG